MLVLVRPRGALSIIGRSEEIGTDLTPSSTTMPTGPVTDGCAALTQADAEAVFDAAATPPSTPTPEAESVVMQCVWSGSGDEAGAQVLQFRLYEGEQFYSADVLADAQVVDVGERAFVRVGDTGVAVQRVRAGNTAELVYTAGVDSEPGAQQLALETLATEIDERLG